MFRSTRPTRVIRPSRMVLNFKIGNGRLRKPTRSCTNNGEPRSSTEINAAIVSHTGHSTTMPTAAAAKSNTRLLITMLRLDPAKHRDAAKWRLGGSKLTNYGDARSSALDPQA